MRRRTTTSPAASSNDELIPGLRSRGVADAEGDDREGRQLDARERGAVAQRGDEVHRSASRPRSAMPTACGCGEGALLHGLGHRAQHAAHRDALLERPVVPARELDAGEAHGARRRAHRRRGARTAAAAARSTSARVMSPSRPVPWIVARSTRSDFASMRTGGVDRGARLGAAGRGGAVGVAAAVAVEVAGGGRAAAAVPARRGLLGRHAVADEDRGALRRRRRGLGAAVASLVASPPAVSIVMMLEPTSMTSPGSSEQGDDRALVGARELDGRLRRLDVDERLVDA